MHLGSMTHKIYSLLCLENMVYIHFRMNGTRDKEENGCDMNLSPRTLRPCVCISAKINVPINQRIKLHLDNLL